LIYFIIIFVCKVLRPPDNDRRPFLGLCMMRASSRWPEHGRYDRRLKRLSRRLPRSLMSEKPSRRLLRSRTSEQPRRRLPRSRTSE
jgi:hypothetical protein